MRVAKWFLPAILLVAMLSSVALAQGVAPGPDFGSHVAMMAQSGCAQTHDRMFGQCVSTMASQGICPCGGDHARCSGM